MNLLRMKMNQKGTLAPQVRFHSGSLRYDIGRTYLNIMRSQTGHNPEALIQEFTPMSINYEMLGDRIRLVRTSRELSQEQLAEAANLTRESINRIEKGSLKAKLDTITVIANILNVPIDYLIGNDETLSKDAETEILKLFLDCNRLEKQILIETLRSLKKILYSAGI